MDIQTPRDSHHPGPPRFLRTGDRIVDPVFVDVEHGFDRDNLAPTIAGTPERDPDEYGADTFTWSVASRPAGSAAAVQYTPTPYDDRDRYDHGTHNTAEFEPDAAGTYGLELDAPDGTHELTVRVFDADGTEATTDGVGGGGRHDGGGPPRIELSGRYDSATETFVVESNPELAPDSYAVGSDLTVEFLPHDASSLDAADIAVEGTTARVPASALDGPTSLYAAPFDGRRVGVRDEILLDPESERVSLPNRPPDWLDDAVVYEIFTRSFGGEPDGTTFDVLADRVDYLAWLGVDVVWLTPVVPAWSPTVETAPGGPHGYSTADYFDVAEDLGTLAEFEAFVDRCHDHDIRVCFDLVANHCGWTHPFFQDTIAQLGEEPEDPYQFPDIEAWDESSDYFDWFDRQRGPSHHDAAPAQTSFFGVRLQPNLNHGNVALREHLLAAVEFWAERVDGFRCDIAWGVPHSFWAEVRERVRAMDADFLLLEEAIPRTPAFAASEFDLHFDTTGFTDAAVAVARGERPPGDLLDAVEARERDGFPRYTRLLNATENHDEARLAHEAAVGDREDPAAVARAAAAAAFALPGVPMLYYGQERLITRHGERRAFAFAGDPDREDDIERDPYKRAFVDWDERPESHLAFYRQLVDFYHDSPALGPDAALVRPAYRTETPEDVLVFGRDAGEAKRVVVVNFAADPRRVTLRPVVDTTDLFTGANVAVDRSDDGVTVEVDRLAVLSTPTLFDCGG
ncbi:alpha-amylase family glycosyl hydrolase [Haloarcula onubensis]|uniref:Alpha-amylase family glycosyl hydrolase n=1 Tax=Haloarcula onubensis TaxID=2950539 RepID=A0ABU2FIG7_9EURY|nr:alpha-amylase family glycosyl hydrolase [Halomicroarcula sp. S3CR25-11]MDS0280538.1 alpha-amylase family glycosyl hydrolase [Halomicroarcula sp. S3CR25-11]